MRSGAIALLALAFGIPAAQDTGSLQIEGLRMTNTQGTLRLQDIRAKDATMASGGTVSHLQTVQAVMQSPPKDDEEPRHANITAPRARLFVAGEDINAENRAAAEVTPELIHELEQLPDKDRAKGDFILEGETANASVGAVVLDIVGGAKILTDQLLWSERALRLVSPTPFIQDGKTPEGDEVTITGAAFAVDREFLDWTYVASANNSVVLTFGEKP